MPLSITAILDQYAWLYTSLPVPNGTWDHVVMTDGAANGLKREADGSVGVYIHGSEDLADWEHDFAQIALPVEHLQLGLVHPGFLAGVSLIKPELDAWVADTQAIELYGHSYGAGRAAILAALWALEGRPVKRVVLFGEPRAGGPKLSQIVQEARVKVESYRNADSNGHDLVTDVPFTLLPQAPYQPLWGPLVDCRHSPRLDDPWVFFRYHHLGHYCRAFGCGTPQALSLPI